MLSTESILSISFTSSLSRYGGDLAVGAMTIITSVSQLVTMPVQGICQGGQLITSYNFGTNNKKRVKEAFLPSLKPASFFTTLCWAVLLLACLRKLILLIPLIFILPLFLSNKVFAVFLAEPVSDILAAAITTITFLSRFNGILNPKDLSSPDIR